MTYMHAAVLGLVQGVAEYLPISSSAHLALTPRLLGWDESGMDFDVFIHFGTLLATLIYFRKDWVAVVRGRWFQFEGLTLGSLLAATLPGVVVGLLSRGYIDAHLRGSATIAFFLAVGGVALWATDRLTRARLQESEVNLARAFGVGVFQCLALLPGMSRSGSTILGGRMMGFDRRVAARLSFLLSMPITFAAFVHELKHTVTAPDFQVTHFGPWVLGATVAFVAGWFTIDLLLKFIQRIGFGVFAVYRCVLAALVWSLL